MGWALSRIRLSPAALAQIAVSRTVVSTTLLAALTLSALLAFSSGVPAAERLSWWHDGCGHSVSFDPAQFDAARLRNTVHLLYGPPDFKAPPVGLPNHPQSVDRLNLDHFRQECTSALEVAGRLEFLPLTGIEEYRHALMAEIRDTCAFQTAQIRGFREPSTLRDYQPAAACAPIVDALEGKRDIMAAFRQTLDRQCTGAGGASCVERELARAQKQDGDAWVRLSLVKFGWNSCASEFTSRSVDSRKLEQMRAGLEDQFRQAFNVINSCEAAADTELRPVPFAGRRRFGHRLGHRCSRHADLCATGLRWSAYATAAALPTPFAADRFRQLVTFRRR
jgi:hypothetical protein